MEELKNMLAYTGINVEQLVDDYVDTLHENNNRRATKEAAIMALKEWAKQKEFLIRQVMAMPGYNGNLQSVKFIEVPYERQTTDTSRSIDNIWVQLFDRGNKLLSKVDENGKSIEDYIKEELSTIPDKIDINDIVNYGGKTHKSISTFTPNGYTNKSVEEKIKVTRLLDHFKYYTDTRLSDNMAKRLNELDPDLRAAEGMKTTRALGKIIKMHGLEDKTSGSAYGKTFIADYCEIMKEGGLKLVYAISVNPIDYLKMSIGEFTSCHNINGGHWRSGCISYMLDKVTMITYTVRPAQEIVSDRTGEILTVKERPELFKKVHRNIFHWDDKYRLIQSRVYPQAYDGTTDLYQIFRYETQARIAEANGWDKNAWVQRKRKYIDFTVGGNGYTNYADWRYPQYGGNLSTPGHAGDPYSTDTIEIGAAPMCVVCGERHDRTSYLTCSECGY